MTPSFLSIEETEFEKYMEKTVETIRAYMEGAAV